MIENEIFLNQAHYIFNLVRSAISQIYFGHSIHDVEYFACAMSSLYTRLIILYEVVLIPLKCYTETINTTKLSSITTAIYSFHHKS